MDKLLPEEFAALNSIKNDAEKAKLKLDLATSEYNLKNMNLKYYILFLYRKYNLNDNSKIDDNGSFVVEKKEEENE